MSHITATIIKNGPLTAKEAVVLSYLCRGYVRREIALRVYRSMGTVSRHIENIAAKLDCHSSAEIVAVAVAAGLVKVEIKHEHSLLLKLMVVIMLVNITASHCDMRRSPRSPRPVRTMRASSRLSRQDKASG